MVAQSMFTLLLGLPLAVSLSSAQASAVDRGGTDAALSVEEFVAQVLERNPGLEAARARARSARSRVAQAGAWDDPQLGVEFFATPVTSLNPIRDGMETDYFLQQMIPFPGKKGAMSDAAEAGALMAGQSVLLAERALVAEAKRVYAMLFSARRRAQVNGDNQRLLEQIIASARSKYSVGIGSQGDVLKLQVELAGLQNERSALEQEAASALAMLNALRNAPAGSLPEQVVDIDPAAPPQSLDSLTRLGLEIRPDLAEMKYQIAMNRSELTAARREWLPDVMIRGMYKQMADQTDQWSAMVGINIPVAPWSIGKTSGKVGENEASLTASEESLQNMQNMAESEIRDAFARAQARWQQISRYRATILPQSQQALEANLAAYRIDKIDFLSLLDSYRMLQMFRMEYTMLIGEYIADVAALERAVGTELH